MTDQEHLLERHVFTRTTWCGACRALCEQHAEGSVCVSCRAPLCARCSTLEQASPQSQRKRAAHVAAADAYFRKHLRRRQHEQQRTGTVIETHGGGDTIAIVLPRGWKHILERANINALEMCDPGYAVHVVTVAEEWRATIQNMKIESRMQEEARKEEELAEKQRELLEKHRRDMQQKFPARPLLPYRSGAPPPRDSLKAPLPPLLLSDADQLPPPPSRPSPAPPTTAPSVERERSPAPRDPAAPPLPYREGVVPPPPSSLPPPPPPEAPDAALSHIAPDDAPPPPPSLAPDEQFEAIVSEEDLSVRARCLLFQCTPLERSLYASPPSSRSLPVLDGFESDEVDQLVALLQEDGERRRCASSERMSVVSAVYEEE